METDFPRYKTGEIFVKNQREKQRYITYELALSFLPKLPVEKKLDLT